MIKSDILRRIRYIFDLNDENMIQIFSLGGLEVTRAQVSDWLKKDEDPDFKTCTDHQLAAFLNGLIIEKRGKKEGPVSEPEKIITNNGIFMKLKIALALQADDVLAILKLAGLEISKHELSAFFRRSDHKHFRPCKDQVLRNFLKGLQLKYRSQA